MRAAPVDISGFPTGAPEISYDEPDDRAHLERMELDTRAYVASFSSSPPIEKVTFAFGLPPKLALFLIRYATPITRGELAGEIEQWVVVGDLPFMCFETEDAPTPSLALQLYCAIAQDWADRVLAGEDLSESYPIPVEPTREYAEMLLSRVALIREELVPRT
ncbi:MAG: hypothetical protein JWQ97_2593 [Phenylobacterium sp.]|nr:hypothetical protein [Phenylobacterium sp.]